MLEFFLKGTFWESFSAAFIAVIAKNIDSWIERSQTK